MQCYGQHFGQTAPSFAPMHAAGLCCRCLESLLLTDGRDPVLNANLCCPKAVPSWGHVCRPSYLEGRLRLADKERQRRQLKAAAPVGDAPAPDRDALKAMEAQANANMAALLLEEASTKVCQLITTCALWPSNPLH